MEESPSSNSLFTYINAPANPGRATSISAFFFSEPTSPSNPRTSLGRSLSGPEPESVKSPESDCFELESSQSFHFHGSSCGGGGGRRSNSDHDFRYLDGYDHQVAGMAYADELFRDGKVLPLKLPPRLQCSNSYNLQWQGCNISNRRLTRSTASSPGQSRRFKLTMPFQRQPALWSDGDEFDPFLNALEKVKDLSKSSHCKAQRRSQSLTVSPLSWGWGCRRSQSTRTDMLAVQNEAVISRVRRANGLDPTRPRRPASKATTSKVDISLRLGANPEDKVEGRRQRMKRFLFKGAALEKKTNYKGAEEHKSAPLLWKPKESKRDIKARTGQGESSAVVKLSRGLKSLVRLQKARLLFRKSFGATTR